MTDHMDIGLLDTSVVIALGEVSATELPTYPAISAITLAELSLGPRVPTTPAERDRRQLVLQTVEASFDPLPFDDACARHFALVASSLRRSGSKSRARAFDALIAATALAHELALYTCNPKDFAGIEGLNLVPVASERGSAT